MKQEQDLQEILAVVKANGTGLTTIIQMLTDLRDNNPSIADEIDAIRTEAQAQSHAIDAILNPPPPEG